MSLIVFENQDFLIADKPHGMPTVPLKNQSCEGTLLGEIIGTNPEVSGVCGKNSWEGGTMHRLDTATSGLVVFALNQKTYDRLFGIQKSGGFVKTYVAKIDGKIDFDTKTVESYFRAYGPFARRVKPELDVRKADSDVLYRTDMKRLSDDTVECRIRRGFRHQIRAHLSWVGIPICGDILYNPAYERNTAGEKIMELDCVKVEFDGFRWSKVR